MEEQVKTNESGKEIVNDDSSIDYISAINEIKQNSVSREQYEKLKNERNELLTSLNNILADENASLVSKTDAIEQKELISSLNEQEVLVETKVMNLGYQDAFVHYTDQGIEVIIVANESSSTAALSIMDLIYETFDRSNSVVVNFKTVEELKSL